jgi:hypothetical protein
MEIPNVQKVARYSSRMRKNIMDRTVAFIESPG